MATRIVEGKKPYTGGKAISIDENKVISLNLRDENNLIIYDEGDDEIYVDLQLDDEITPTDAFPVGITTGRVVVDNGWDKAGTIICAKTTSGDVIKLVYADEGTLWIDNGTGTFKQIYFKSDVDAIITTLTTYINTELAKKQNGVASTTAPSNPSEGDLWYDTTNSAMKVWDGTAWQSVGTGGGGSDIVYATQAEYEALLPGAESDNKHYFIYTESGGGWQPGVNTLLYYSFDNQNLNDDSGNGNNGTRYSTAGTYTTGISSYGVDVSNNAAITLPVKLPSGDMTFSICANVTTISGVLQGFLGVDGWASAGQMTLSMDDTQGINLLIHKGGSVDSIVTNIIPTTNTWFNVIFTRSGNVWTVYYNGTLRGVMTSSQSPSQNITYYISKNYNNDRYIRGVIDEVILENRAWTPQEITDYVTSLGIS